MPKLFLSDSEIRILLNALECLSYSQARARPHLEKLAPQLMANGIRAVEDLKRDLREVLSDPATKTQNPPQGTTI